MQITQPREFNKGLTLIEVLVALGIGALLLGGAASMFVSNQRIYNEQQMMSRLQEDMRWTLETLLYDIRMAGHLGCVDDPGAVNNIVHKTLGWVAGTPSDDITVSNVLEGMEGSATPKTWKPGTETEGITSALGSTDGISMRFMEPIVGSPRLSAAMTTVAVNIPLTNTADLVNLDLAAVADCEQADVFLVTSVNNNSLEHNAAGNTSVNLTRAYDETANVFRYRARRYLIQGVGGDANRPALSRIEFLTNPLGTASTPIVEGVENMQLAYQGAGGNFQTADDVTNWQQVSAVRLALLFRTVIENFHLQRDNSTYNLLGGSGSKGSTFAASDNRRRRVFTTTVQIRNRR